MNESRKERPAWDLAGDGPMAPIVGGFALGAHGGKASLWAKDLAELAGFFPHLRPGLHWIRFILAVRGEALEEIESLGRQDWGFVHVRPGGGWLMGTPGLAEAVEEMGEILGGIGGPR